MVQLILKSLKASSKLEEWTAAIKEGDNETIAEQLQVPRGLLQRIRFRGELMAIRLEPVVIMLADRLLLEDPIDIKGAIKLLTDFIWWTSETERSDLSTADKWFYERSNDEVTPVSGDARRFIQACSQNVHQAKR